MDMNVGARAREARPANRLQLTAGVVGPVLFMVVALIEGATRPGYSAWRNFISSLSLSDQGWEQIANFLVCGALIFAFALALPRAMGPSGSVRVGAVLLAALGVGLIAAGIFVTDPALGYPPGATPSVPITWHQTWNGTLHGLAGLFDFTSLGVAAFVLARRFAGDPRWKGWVAFSIVVGVVVLASFVGGIVTSVLDQKGIWPDAPNGVIQRVGVVFGWTWIALLAWRLLRAQSGDSAALRASEKVARP